MVESGLSSAIRDPTACPSANSSSHSYEDLWNRQDPSRLHDILTPSFSFRGSLGVEKTGPEEFWDYVRYVVEPLGDYRCDIEVVVSGGQRALAKMWVSGIHRGELLGFQPTGEASGLGGRGSFQENGRLNELWVLGDVAGLRGKLSGGS